MDFEPCFKVHNLVSVHPKSIKLGQIKKKNQTWSVPCAIPNYSNGKHTIVSTVFLSFPSCRYFNFSLVERHFIFSAIHAHA